MQKAALERREETMFDFVRVAAAVPRVSVGNVPENTRAILEKARAAGESGLPFGVEEGTVKSCETGCKNAATRAAP